MLQTVLILINTIFEYKKYKKESEMEKKALLTASMVERKYPKKGKDVQIYNHGECTARNIKLKIDSKDSFIQIKGDEIEIGDISPGGIYSLNTYFNGCRPNGKRCDYTTITLKWDDDFKKGTTEKISLKY